jgi:hypothetical protein
VKIISLLVSTPAVFLRKGKLVPVSIKCRSHKNFKGPLKLKRELAGACKKPDVLIYIANFALLFTVLSLIIKVTPVQIEFKGTVA